MNIEIGSSPLVSLVLGANERFIFTGAFSDVPLGK
jgi:hypothetical protein